MAPSVKNMIELTREKSSVDAYLFCITFAKSFTFKNMKREKRNERERNQYHGGFFVYLIPGYKRKSVFRGGTVRKANLIVKGK